MTEHHNLMIIAGEVSGDIHAASLVKAIRERRPDVSFFGIGGPAMRSAGVETAYDIKDMAVMGLSEVLRRFFFFRRVFYEMVAEVSKRSPTAVILVDYPGFNLRFAARVHKKGFRVIYYICPQVWAWNQRRIPKMARIVDHLVTIFPFEKDHFGGTDLRVDFAGHPLVDEAAAVRKEAAHDLPWHGGNPKVAFLPGSRVHEVERILPLMWAAGKIIEASHPGASFIIAAPSEEIASCVRDRLAELPTGPTRYRVVSGRTRQVLLQAQAALVASGTATIEAALMHCPMVIAYKVSPLTYALAKHVVKVKNIGMVNIVAGREICPEFVQENATPQALAEAAGPLLTDTPMRRRMIDEIKEVHAALGHGGASERAADLVLKNLQTDADLTR